jgi:hypothetical protein
VKPDPDAPALKRINLLEGLDRFWRFRGSPAEIML